MKRKYIFNTIAVLAYLALTFYVYDKLKGKIDNTTFIAVYGVVTLYFKSLLKKISKYL